MKCWWKASFFLFLSSCTITITPTPIQRHPQVYHQHIRNQVHPRLAPTPKSPLSPVPPDDRISDIIRQLDKERH